jgi:hypothetical protein
VRNPCTHGWTGTATHDNYTGRVPCPHPACTPTDRIEVPVLQDLPLGSPERTPTFITWRLARREFFSAGKPSGYAWFTVNGDCIGGLIHRDYRRIRARIEVLREFVRGCPGGLGEDAAAMTQPNATIAIPQ